MPGFLITQSSTVGCAHQGRATPTTVVPTVIADGSPVVTLVTPYSVAACSFTSPPGPCATGMWTSGATRVMANGQPLAIMLAPGTCAPNGAPMTATQTQAKVQAT
jgi:hypothetical protein